MSDSLGAFLTLIAGLNSNIIPEGDAEDVRNGATHIPPEVTDARRAGKHVPFVQNRGQEYWHWVLPSGKKIYHSAP